MTVKSVSSAEITELLTAALAMPLDAALDDQITFYERKARLMSRVARDVDTSQA